MTANPAVKALVERMVPSMELREALYTTRAMRRVSDKPIPQDVHARILDAAVRARAAATHRTGVSSSSTTRR